MPDPDNLWTFAAGQARMIGTALSFRVDTLHADYIEGTQVLDRQEVRGELWLNMPVVIVRDAATREPRVTLTLRRIGADVAYIQVTAHPGITRLSMN